MNQLDAQETHGDTTDRQEPLVLPSLGHVEDVARSSTSRGDRLVAFIGAAVVVALVIVYGAWQWQTLKPVTPHVVVAVPVAPRQPSVPNPYASVPLDARAAIVYDVRANRPLFKRNSDAQLPLASLTKLMTSLVAVESLSTNTRIAVSPYAIDTEGDSGLFANETWKLGDLVSFTLLTSSNDGADAVAAAVGGIWQTTPEISPVYEHVDSFVSKMNLRARELGLVKTKYNNPTGLDEYDGEDGGLGSARDMAILITYLWEQHPEAIRDTTMPTRVFRSEDGFVHKGENTNEYVTSTPGILASKTGYTDLAGGNLAILYNAGLDHPIAVVVLGSTREGRFKDVQKLVDATYRYEASGWYEYEVAGSTSPL